MRGASPGPWILLFQGSESPSNPGRFSSKSSKTTASKSLKEKRQPKKDKAARSRSGGVATGK
jgi:hypothetical protein